MDLLRLSMLPHFLFSGIIASHCDFDKLTVTNHHCDHLAKNGPSGYSEYADPVRHPVTDCCSPQSEPPGPCQHNTQSLVNHVSQVTLQPMPSSLNTPTKDTPGELHGRAGPLRSISHAVSFELQPYLFLTGWAWVAYSISLLFGKPRLSFLRKRDLAG